MCSFGGSPASGDAGKFSSAAPEKFILSLKTAWNLLMKVGDLVEHFVDGTYGIIIRDDCEESPSYPYLVRFVDGLEDWFDPSAVKVVSESR